jgi:hypothetical protein
LNCNFTDFADRSEGIETSDDLAQIFLSLFDDLGNLLHPEAVQPKNRGSLRDDYVRAWERSA